MIPLAALTLLRRFGPYLAILAACVAAYLWIHGMQATIAKDRASIASLQAGLAAEQQARKADVAGLTTLAQGTAAVTIKTKSDTAILGTVIDAKNSAPSSPGLAALMQCLREASAGGRQCSPTAGAASATPRGA